MTESLALTDHAASVIDYSPLTRRLTRGEVTRFRLKAAREKTVYPARARPDLEDILATLGAVVVSLPVIVFELAILIFAVASPADLVGSLVFGLGSIALAGSCIYLIWRDHPLADVASNPWPERFRIAEFARVNGFAHITESPSPFAPADPNAIPGSGVATTRIVARDHPALEIANVRYVKLSWNHPIEIQVGYLALARPPRITTNSLGKLQQTFDDSGLGLTIRTSGDWVLLFSAAALDLGAPQTYRMLLWIATQVDRRRAPLEPVPAATFVAEARQIAKLRQDNFVRRLFLGCVAVGAAWALAILVARLSL